MKILKPGKVEQRKFVCPVCGCVFSASINEMNECTDFFTCPQEGCRFDAIDWEDNGEPYEEPTPTATQDTRTDAVKLYELAKESWPYSIGALSDLVDFLIANGVTFREG